MELCLHQKHSWYFITYPDINFSNLLLQGPFALKEFQLVMGNFSFF